MRMKPYIDPNNPSRFYYGKNEEDWIQLTQDTIEKLEPSKLLRQECIFIFGELYDWIYLYGDDGNMGATIKYQKGWINGVIK